MYHQYFGFAEAPFSIAPDPRYLYLSQRHQEALAHLLYGVNGNGGFVLLTGEIGAGKTTVCRCLLEQIPPDCDVAYIFNPKLTVEELLSTLCTEFGIAIPPGTNSVKVFVDCINAYLLDAHARQRHTVLIIDEAQNLSPVVLEQMRLLTNLETSQSKLLQIILIGQPELATLLERPELRQVSQRIVARYHLGPLSKTEVAAYVRHRLEVAGAKPGLIPARLTGRLYRLSAGVPRVINVLCDRALLGAYVEGKEHVDGATLSQAAREVFHRPAGRSTTRLFALSAALLVVVVAALAAALYRYEPQRSPVTALLPADTKAPTPVQTVALNVGTAHTDAVPIDAAPNAAALSQSLAWPAAERFADSLPLAYTTLFRVWGEDYRPGLEACQQASALGLRCYSARGGLDELRRLNRPAVLRMRSAQGEQFHATLIALGENSASFAIGAQRTRIALAALAAQWSGHYLVLWRAPPQVPGDLVRAGERGAAVQWLAVELARANGRPIIPNDQAVFDEALAHEVKAFQLAQGLVPDGAVGRQTLMRLASLGDRAAPTLEPRQMNK
jgi:general secretion pathway protein A